MGCLKFYIKEIGKKLSTLFKDIGDDRVLFVGVLFLFSFVITLTYSIIPKVFSNNLESKLMMSLTFVWLLLIVLVFVILEITFHKWGVKRWGLLLIFCLIFYFLKDKGFKDWSYYLLGILLFIVFFTYPFILRRGWKKPNFWVISTLIIMLFSFLCGVIIINSLWGYDPISAYLNVNGDSHNRYGGEDALKCNSVTKTVFVGSNLTCFIKPNLTITNWSISFTHYLGDVETLELNRGTINFLAPQNVSNLYLKIWGVTFDNKSIFISTSFDYSFYTFEENKERNKNFVTYFLALIGIILFSIPLMMVNFKELLIKNKK